MLPEKFTRSRSRSLYLGLIDAVDGKPSEAASDYDGPQAVALVRVRIQIVELDPTSFGRHPPGAAESSFLSETEWNGMEEGFC